MQPKEVTEKGDDSLIKLNPNEGTIIKVDLRPETAKKIRSRCLTEDIEEADGSMTRRVSCVK